MLSTVLVIFFFFLPAPPPAKQPKGCFAGGGAATLGGEKKEAKIDYSVPHGVGDRIINGRIIDAGPRSWRGRKLVTATKLVTNFHTHNFYNPLTSP